MKKHTSIGGVLVLLAMAALAAAQGGISLHARTTFHVVTASATNPFKDIKLSATFKHLTHVVEFEMPVVVTQDNDGEYWEFPVIFTPNMTGNWEWWMTIHSVVNGASVNLGSAPTTSNRAGFTCVTSSLRGWRRPAIASSPSKPIDPPGAYPHALVEPKGTAPSPTSGRYRAPSSTSPIRDGPLAT